MQNNQQEKPGNFPRWNKLLEQVKKEREKQGKHGNTVQGRKNHVMSESR